MGLVRAGSSPLYQELLADPGGGYDDALETSEQFRPTYHCEHAGEKNLSANTVALREWPIPLQGGGTCGNRSRGRDAHSLADSAGLRASPARTAGLQGP